MKLAIVGMGVAGMSALKTSLEKLERSNSAWQIDCYDVKHLLGRGVPYQDDDPMLLNNPRADQMSFYPENRFDFVEWAKRKYGCVDEYLPRALFGEYLVEQTAKLIAHKNVNTHYTHIKQMIRNEDGTFTLRSESGTETYDGVHLCLGHLPYKDPYHLKGTANFIYNPYPMKYHLHNLPENKRIAVIGIGLTGLDAMRYARKYLQPQKIQLFSKSGMIPTIRGHFFDIKIRYFTEETVQEICQQNNGLIPLAEALALFNKELRYQGVDLGYQIKHFGHGTITSIKAEMEQADILGRFQCVLNKIDHIIALIWNRMTNTDKLYYRKHYEPVFHKFRSPVPNLVGEELIAALESDTVEILQDLTTAQKTVHGFSVQTKQATYPADIIINATGYKTQLNTITVEGSPLFSQLLNDRFLQREDFGGFLTNYEDLSVISPRFGEIKTLKLHGESIPSIDYANNSAERIINKARTAALAMLRALD